MAFYSEWDYEEKPSVVRDDWKSRAESIEAECVALRQQVHDQRVLLQRSLRFLKTHVSVPNVFDTSRPDICRLCRSNMTDHAPDCFFSDPQVIALMREES